MDLQNIEETVAYLEEKFTSFAYTAKAIPLTDFGPVMKFHLQYTKANGQTPTECDGPVWVAPSRYTAAVPFAPRTRR